MELCGRQVHLDFHTSPDIEEIGRDFSPDEFAETLSKAHVNSVTCFARCHHGWIYYPSKQNPELIHPNLMNHNLLIDQINACHSRGIKAPVYTTVRWDEKIMKEKPEWLCRDMQGHPVDMGGVPEPHFYYGICLNSGYRDFFKNHLEDIIDVVGEENLDGIFMDIVVEVECACDSCRRKMKARGMDVNSRADRARFAAMTLGEFRMEISELIRRRAPKATVFFNGGNPDKLMKRTAEAYSHLELESLASGKWGYDYFTVTSRYAGHFGKAMLGMTGKFHTGWGDFHSLKNLPALEFECFHMLAMGAGCSIGDQLHPWGRLSDATYELIRTVYESVEAKEPWLKGATPAAEIAVMYPNENYSPVIDGDALQKSLVGACHILQELAYQYTIIDSEMPFEPYKVLILPDKVDYSEALYEKLCRYVDSGGRVFATFDSCISDMGENRLFGVRGVKASEYSREFILPNDRIGVHLPKEPFVMYERGMDIGETDGEIVMEKTLPWMERANGKFCGHLHAPTPGNVRKPEIVRRGNVYYCVHPVFSIYRKNAPRWCKELVRDVLETLLPVKLTEHNGPSTVYCILNHRGGSEDVLHLLHYIPLKNAEEIYTIEDVIPLCGLEVSVATVGKKATSVRLVPEGENLPYVEKEERIEFVLERLEGHQMVEIQYGKI